MKLWNYSGTLLTATGIIHTGVALILNGTTYKEMIGNGLAKENFRQAYAVWFFICGLLNSFMSGASFGFIFACAVGHIVLPGMVCRRSQPNGPSIF